MIEYLQNYCKYTTTGLTVEEKKELEQLRVEVKKYRDKEAQENPTKDLEEVSESCESEGEDRVDADFDRKLAKRQQDKKGMKRVGVSAEVYGDYNKKENFDPVMWGTPGRMYHIFFPEWKSGNKDSRPYLYLCLRDYCPMHDRAC